MPRPHKCRKICSNPDVVYFKPAGMRMHDLEEVVITLDEFEAIRLADYEGLYQEKAAEQMNVSRQTFGNIINSAHKKIADFIINAKALQISGGMIEISPEMERYFLCRNCEHQFEAPFGTEKPKHCPSCESSDIYRDGDNKRNKQRCNGHHNMDSNNGCEE